MSRIKDLCNRIQATKNMIAQVEQQLEEQLERLETELQEGLDYAGVEGIDVVMPSPFDKPRHKKGESVLTSQEDVKPDLPIEADPKWEDFVLEGNVLKLKSKATPQSSYAPVEVLLPPVDEDDEEGAVDHACAVVTMMQAKPITQDFI